MPADQETVALLVRYRGNDPSGVWLIPEHETHSFHDPEPLANTRFTVEVLPRAEAEDRKESIEASIRDRMASGGAIALTTREEARIHFEGREE